MSDMIGQARATYTRHYRKIEGKKVARVVRSVPDEFTEETFGLEFEDGTIAWIMRDPEGNGPGFLDIQERQTNAIRKG